MAENGGTKIGTMFAEIDLDRSKYDAGLDRALSDGKSVSIDVEKAWRTMGTRSTEHVDKMRASVVNAYELIRNKSTSTAADIERAESAAYAKLEKIHRKFYGGTVSKIKEVETTAKKATGVFAEMFGSFTAANLATDAIYALGRAMKTVFTDSFNSVEEFRLSSASLGATIATFAKTSGRDMADVYKQSYAYAEQLNLKMEEWNAKTVATGENLRAMVETMAQAGIVVDVNNKKQEEGIIAIANALAIVTKGQEQDKQFRQETRGLLDGEVRFTNRLSVMIDSMVEGPLTKQVEKWRESGTLIENLGIMLTGFSAATKDLEHIWLSVSTTMETVYHRVLRGMFVPVYEDIVNLSREYTLEMLNQESKGSALAEILRTVVYRAWVDIKNVVSIVGGTIAAFEVPLKFMGTILGLALDGWGQILSVIEPVYKRITNMVGAMWELVEAAGNYGNMLYMFTTLRFDQAWQAWENTKASWNEAGKKTGNALAVGFFDEIEDKIAEYNKKLKGIEIDPKIKAPEMMGTAGKTVSEEVEKAAKKIEKIQDEFWEKHLKSILTETEYKKIQLEIQYIKYSNYVEDKDALNRWYFSELRKLSEESYEDLESRSKATEAAFAAGIDARFEDQVEAYEELTKAEKEYQEEQQKLREDAYKDFSDTIQENTADILRDWDNAWEAMTDIMKNALIEMAAEALTSNIIVPIAMQVGSAMGMSWNGVPMSSMTSGSMGTGGGILSNGFSLLSNGQSLWNAYSGATFDTVYSGLGSLGIGAGMGSGVGTGVLSGVQGGGMSAVGGSGMGTSFASGAAAAAPYLAAAAVVVSLMANGTLDFGDSDPDIGLYGSGYRRVHEFDEGGLPFQIDWSDMSESAGQSMAASVSDYLGTVLDDLSDNFGLSMSETFSEKYFKIKLDTADFETAGDLLVEMGDQLFKKGSSELVSGLMPGYEGTFDTAFFESIQADTETLFDTFTRFASLATTMNGFESRFAEQVGGGASTTEAFQNIEAINAVLLAASLSIESMASSATIASLENVSATYSAYIQAMEDAAATQGELAQLQIAMAQEIGSVITGLNANTIQGGIISAATGGSSLTDAMTATINASLAQTIAGVASENIMADYVAVLNQQVGEAVNASMTDGSLDAGALSDLVTGIMAGFDWEGMEGSVSAAIDSVNALIGATEEEVIATEDLADVIDFTTARTKLQVEILELEGKTAEALAMSRDLELSAMDESLQPLQERIYALEDEATASELATAAAEEAAKVASQIAEDRASLELEIMKLEGKSVEALAIERQNELDALDTTLWSLQERIYNLEDEAEATEAASQAMAEATAAAEENADKWQTIAGTWVDFLDVTGQEFNTELFLKSLGLAGDSEYGNNLISESVEDLFRNQMALTVAYESGEINLNQFNSMLSHTTNGFTAFQTALEESQQAIEDEAASRAENKAAAIGIDYESNKYYWSIVKPPTEWQETINGIVEQMEIFRQSLLKTGYTPSWKWNAGGEIEGELISAALVTMTKGYTDQILSLTGRTDLLRADEIQTIDEQFRPLQQIIWALEDLGDVAGDVAATISSAIDSVDSTIASIMGSSDMTPQSKEWFTSQYSTLYSAAQSDPGSVSDFTSFATQYLDFMNDYGDPATTEKVLADLNNLNTSLESDLSLADLSGGSSLGDIFDILSEIEANTGDYGATQTAMEMMVAQAYSDIGKDGIGTGVGQIDQAGWDYWMNLLMTDVLTPEKFNTAFDAAVARINGPSFAGGGIISGPSSGYTIPTTFHGTEHITTDADMTDVKELLTKLVVMSNNGSNTQVKVYIGNKELKDITAEIIRTDPETQRTVKRVANV